MLYDITELLSERTPAWEGDTRFSRHDDFLLSRGDPYNVTRIAGSVHVGTHCDAPRHFFDDGLAVDTLPLDRFTGVCRVVEVIGDGPVGPEDWSPDVLRGVQRLLLKTRTRPLRQGDTRCAHLTGEAARALVEARVRLVGIDTPSMDALDSTEFPAHRALLGAGVPILERLELSRVPPGQYELFAFPLRIEGADGAPVRAVLRTL